MKWTRVGSDVGGRGDRGGRRARPDPEAARDPAQLPGRRAPPLPARADRARAAPVHRHRQRRGAAVQPRPAAVGLRLGQAENNYFGFGTDNDIEHGARLPDHQAPDVRLPGAPTGSARGRGPHCRARRSSARPARPAQAFRPASIVNISAMSFGSLRATPSRRSTAARRWPAACRTPAKAALALPPQRRRLVFQIGTGYFGCRDERRPLRPRPAQGPGRLGAGAGASRSSSARARSRASAACCPAAKVPRRSPRSAASRRGRTASARPGTGVPRRRHAARLRRAARRATGLPVGIKSAVGDLAFWVELAER